MSLMQSLVNMIFGNRSSFHKIILLFMLVGLGWGCGASFPKPASFKPTPDRFHKVLQTRQTQVQSLSGEVSVEIWQKKERIKVRQLFAVKAPSFLRMDTLSPFESPLATLVSDGQWVSLYDQNQGRFFKDTATIDHFEKLSHLRLKPDDLVTLLRGQIPRLVEQGGEVKWDEKKGLSVLYLEDKAHAQSQKIYFEEPSLKVRELKLYQNQVLQVRVQLAKYTSQKQSLPQRLRIHIPIQEIEVNVVLKEYTLNPNLPPEAFQHTAPPHLTPESL